MGTVALQPLDGQNVLRSKVDSTSGTTAAPGGTTGLIIRVYKLFLVINTPAVTIKFQDGSTDLTGAMSLAANGSITLDLDGQPWFVCSSGNAFNITQSGTTQISGAVYYTLTAFN